MATVVTGPCSYCTKKHARLDVREYLDNGIQICQDCIHSLRLWRRFVQTVDAELIVGKFPP